MRYSLNEIDAQCRKAVRGAGFEWGYAEEAGKVLRWLAKYDLPGVKVLAAYLVYLESQKKRFDRPTALSNHITKPNTNAAYCPILTGAYLCDRSTIDIPLKFAIEYLVAPLLLLPYLATIASHQHKTITFLYTNTRLTYADQQLNVETRSSISTHQTNAADIKFNDRPVRANRAIDYDQDIAKQDWQILNQFASRTYVPASALSRQGAGSEEDRVR